MTEFFQMGGYAFYVWCSYGAVAALLVYGIFAPLRLRKKLLMTLAEELSQHGNAR